MLTPSSRCHAGIVRDDAPQPGAAPQVGTAPRDGADTGENVLDSKALDRLRELDPTGGNQLLIRIIKAFEVSAARLLPQLQEAQRTNDLASMRYVAHTLKSSSASIGAVKLSQLCADTESKIRTNHLENLDEGVQALRAELAIVLQALTRLLDAKS